MDRQIPPLPPSLSYFGSRGNYLDLDLQISRTKWKIVKRKFVSLVVLLVQKKERPRKSGYFLNSFRAFSSILIRSSFIYTPFLCRNRLKEACRNIWGTKGRHESNVGTEERETPPRS
jgi:hypothetical protein